MLLDRINTWLLNRLPSRRFGTSVTVIPAGLQIRGRRRAEIVTWSNVNEVYATRSEQLVGHTFLLVFGLVDGRALTVPDDSPAWRELTALLPECLPGITPYQEWALQLATADPPDRLAIFRR